METKVYPGFRVLHLEDTARDRELVELSLLEEDPTCQIQHVQNEKEFLSALEEHEFDVILADKSLPGFDGATALRIAREKHPDLPFIFVTGSMGEEQAIETIKSGATDYVLKHRLARLLPAVHRALGEARERRKTQNALKALAESEQRFQLIAKATNDALWDWDIQNNTVWLSEGFQIFGYKPQDMQPAMGFWMQRIHAADQARIKCELDDAIHNGKNVWSSEYRFQRADHSWAHVFDRGYVMRDAEGEAVRMVGAMMDISERKKHEERIREQAALLEKAGDGILVCDLELHILFWNKGAENIYGWSAMEALEKNLAEILPKNETSKLQEIYQRVLAQGEWIGELNKASKTGALVVSQSRWTLVKENDGKAKSILIINTDITEKKLLEAQFLRAQRMESIGILAGGIAHDLNNVLAPIMMVGELLRAKTEDRGSLELLDTLEGSAKHGAELIKQILAFARGVEGERSEMQAGHLIREICKILRETLPRSIEIQTRLPKDLWVVRGVPTHLNQVLMNLCVNARDAMPNGGQIKISAENIMVDEAYAHGHLEASTGPYIMISVTDTGTGIPPKILEHIYDPFFSTKETGKGTGLGLSTVKGIIKSHGGFIHVYSEPGRGTSFKIYLPALLSTEAAQDEVRRANLPRGHDECILVVDDEIEVRNITRLTLERYNYRVLTAADGVEGLALYAKHRHEIRLVLTDLMMPQMEGQAMIRALQRFDPKVKVIALSGMMEINDVESGGALHGIERIQKPFTSERLLTSIQQILASS